MIGNKCVAIKIIFNIELNKSNRERALEEADLLKEINSDYIIRYIDSFKEKHYSGIITEYCQYGDLKQLISKHKSILNCKIPDNNLNDYVMQLISGLCYLHDNKIIHRDIKPENIFLTEENKLKYGDLGISRISSTFNNKDLTHLVGSPNYMSPEIVNEKNYNNKSDIWSLGCVIYELITLNKLFNGNVTSSVLIQITKFKSLEPVHTTIKLQLILNRALIVNQNERANVDELEKIMLVSDKIKLVFLYSTLSYKKSDEKDLNIASIKHLDQGYSIRTEKNIPLVEPTVNLRDKKNSVSTQSDFESVSIFNIYIIIIYKVSKFFLYF
jgi:NIMA (never in mitosis gene a)-related kinase 1/4/5